MGYNLTWYIHLPQIRILSALLWETSVDKLYQGRLAIKWLISELKIDRQIWCLTLLSEEYSNVKGQNYRYIKSGVFGACIASDSYVKFDQQLWRCKPFHVWPVIFVEMNLYMYEEVKVHTSFLILNNYIPQKQAEFHIKWQGETVKNPPKTI